MQEQLYSIEVVKAIARMKNVLYLFHVIHEVLLIS